MDINQRKAVIRRYLLRERLVDNGALGRIEPLSGRPKFGYSTQWITSAYEELCRILPDMEASECDPFLVGFSEYQISKYWTRVSEEDLERFVALIAESPYALSPAIEVD